MRIHFSVIDINITAWHAGLQRSWWVTLVYSLTFIIELRTLREQRAAPDFHQVIAVKRASAAAAQRDHLASSLFDARQSTFACVRVWENATGDLAQPPNMHPWVDHRCSGPCSLEPRCRCLGGRVATPITDMLLTSGQLINSRAPKQKKNLSWMTACRRPVWMLHKENKKNLRTTKRTRTSVYVSSQYACSELCMLHSVRSLHVRSGRHCSSRWILTVIYYPINRHLKDRLQMEFTAWKIEPMPETALTSFTLYVTHIASLWARHSYWRQEVGHAQNI